MMEFSEEVFNDFYSSILDVWQRSKYASGCIYHLNPTFFQDKENSGPLLFLGTYSTQFVES